MGGRLRCWLRERVYDVKIASSFLQRWSVGCGAMRTMSGKADEELGMVLAPSWGVHGLDTGCVARGFVHTVGYEEQSKLHGRMHI